MDGQFECQFLRKHGREALLYQHQIEEVASEDLASGPYAATKFQTNTMQVGTKHSPANLMNVPRQSLATRDVLIDQSREMITQSFDHEPPAGAERLATHHQRCESGSTGYSYPEPANSDSNGLPRPNTRAIRPTHKERVADGALLEGKQKKKVQFRNVATDPDLVSADESQLISREDTLAEPSVVINDQDEDQAVAPDYLQALQSVKLHAEPIQTEPAQTSGECVLTNSDGGSGGGVLANNFMGFSAEEDKIIEKSLMQIRDRIRSGQLLSHQVPQDNNRPETDRALISTADIRVEEYLNTPDEKSENVQSSGIANTRLSKVPIGSSITKDYLTTESSGNVVLSSKPSQKNANLSKREMFSVQPHIGKLQETVPSRSESHKASPAGILKRTSKFSMPSVQPNRQQSNESLEQNLDQLKMQFKQPPLPVHKRQNPNRIHTSVTYSPVSHCITRDAANIFEKKKQRMEKIQRLRGASNQSEADKFNDSQQRDADSLEAKKNGAQLKKNEIRIDQIRRQTASLPQTPREAFIESIMTKMKFTHKKDQAEVIEEESNKPQKPLKPQINGKAPPVTGSNTNAQNSIQKRKKATRQPRLSNATSEHKTRNESSGNRNGASKESKKVSSRGGVDQNLIHFYLNPNPHSSQTQVEPPSFNKRMSSQPEAVPRKEKKLQKQASIVTNQSIGPVPKQKISYASIISSLNRLKATQQTNEQLNRQLKAVSNQIARKQPSLQTDRSIKDLRQGAAKPKSTNPHTLKDILSSSHSGKQASASSKKPQQRDKQNRQKTVSKSISANRAAPGVKAISNFLTQGGQQGQILQKEQIIFILAQMQNQTQMKEKAGDIRIAKAYSTHQTASRQDQLVKARYVSTDTHTRQQNRHQRCESGSTGYSYPEPANSDSNGLPRPNTRAIWPTQLESVTDGAPLEGRQKKKVQFRNVATEPNIVSADESHQISHEDTLAEPSVVINDQDEDQAVAPDYLQALQSVKLHAEPIQTEPAQTSGECVLTNSDGGSGGGVLANNFMGFSAEEDKIIEKSLMQIRDRIRSGQLLSHQVPQERNHPETDREQSANSVMKVEVYHRSPEDQSENIPSSGIAHMRLSNVPIGFKAGHDNLPTESSGNVVLSSKPSQKNANLSKREMFSVQPHIGKLQETVPSRSESHKASPAGILKRTSKFSMPSVQPNRQQSNESLEQNLDQLKMQFKQPPLPVHKRQNPNRIHTSVTYSPVSHCITRDAANIFEKKKQRMEKIQRLRGTSNQSETDMTFKEQSSTGTVTTNIFSQHVKLNDSSNVIKPDRKSHENIHTASDLSKRAKLASHNSVVIVNLDDTRDEKKQRSKRKQPASQPLTPRKFNVENILQKLAAGQKVAAPDVITEHALNIDKQSLRPKKYDSLSFKPKKVVSQAPPVTGTNTNAQNSVQKKKKATRQPRLSNATSEHKAVIKSNGPRAACSKESKKQSSKGVLDQNFMNFYLNPSSSTASIDFENSQKPTISLQKILAQKANAPLSKQVKKREQSMALQKRQPQSSDFHSATSKVQVSHGPVKRTAQAKHDLVIQNLLQINMNERTGPLGGHVSGPLVSKHSQPKINPHALRKLGQVKLHAGLNN